MLLLEPEILLAEAPYRLPWAEGSTFSIAQAPDGWISTHTGVDNRYAVDFDMPQGTAVLAARRGIVVATEARHGATPDEDPITPNGNYVRVRHEDGTFATYAHLMHGGVSVAPGERVEVGSVLGRSGSTGEARGAQLHFGVSRMRGAYEASVPVTFYVGVPPVEFAPRTLLEVRANYSSSAEPPRTPLERRFVPWKRPELPPEQVPAAWLTLVSFGAALVAGILWFWRFSRSDD